MAQLSPQSLPDDVAALKAIIAGHAETLQARDAELYAQSLLIEKLKAQLVQMRRALFGASSENLDQLELLIEAIETDQAEYRTKAVIEPLLEDQEHPKRKPLPAHLPREDIMYAPEADCTHCGKPMRKLGEDIREQLDYVPGHFMVIRHVRPKLSCRDCGHIVQAPMPSLPIERGKPGAALLAHVLVSKYPDHLPLYRQAQIFGHQGVELARSTMRCPAGKRSAAARRVFS